MHKSEAEKIDSILDEHQQIYRRHNRIDNILAYCACIAWIPCIIAAFGVDGIYLKILFAVLACCGAVCFFIFFFTLLPESLMVLSRQSLLQLMRLTEDVPDVRQELLNRLLSGKKLTGRDEQDGFAPIFPDTCYHLTHYWLAAVDIPVASDNPVHYADAIRYNARTPLQGSLLPLTRLVWA